MIPLPRRDTVVLMTMILMMAGCGGSESEQLARMEAEHARAQAAQSQQSTERQAAQSQQMAELQAAQNRQMAELHKEVAQGTRRLVEENAEARKETVALQQELQSERVAVGRQRDALETERKELAKERRTDPIIASAITQVGLILACLLPLVLCWYLLHRPPEPETDQMVLETLIEDLVSERPRFLPPPGSRQALDYRDGQPPSGDPSLLDDSEVPED